MAGSLVFGLRSSFLTKVTALCSNNPNRNPRAGKMFEMAGLSCRSSSSSSSSTAFRAARCFSYKPPFKFDPTVRAGVGEMARAECSEHWEVFKTWMSEHERNYQGENEMLFRFGVFSDRLKWIEEENKKNRSYKMGLTQFTDSTPEELPFGRSYGSPFEKEDETVENVFQTNPLKIGFNYIKKHGIRSNEKEGERSQVVRISGYKSVAPDEKSFIEALCRQPVAVIIAGHISLFHYKEGVYNGPFGNDLHHCMLAVAYDPHCITLKNCWGTSWGEEGLMRIVRQLPGHPYGPGGLYTRVVYPTMDKPFKMAKSEFLEH